MRATPAIAAALRSGLSALRTLDRSRVSAARPRALCGSIDLDEALKNLLPNDSRWDYGIGIAQGSAEKVFWVEVHPATDGGASEVEAKLLWLRDWLKQQAPALFALERSFVWIASGAVTISPKSSARRRLAAMGLRFVGGHLKLL